MMDSESYQLLLSRDANFLKALFIEVNPFLLRICLANSIYDENADDILHQTWATFFTNLEKFQGKSQIRTFICGILFNKIREHRRFQGKAQYEEDSEKVMSQAFTFDGWWNQIPHGPDKILELRQSGELIKECLEGLSEQQKAAFVLKEVEEETSEEICHVLGVNVTHLRVLLFRAKDKLRKCLEGHASVEQS
jgi:RNA polymerase sigma-70 factor, ECF subfamily